MALIVASPSGEHRHADAECAMNDAGPWPPLKMSESAAEERGLDECPECLATPDPDPGFGLDTGPDDAVTGGAVMARTSAQWYRGVVERRYRRPEDGVELRLTCSSVQGYEFHLELMTTGRLRVRVPHQAYTANVLELEAGP